MKNKELRLVAIYSIVHIAIEFCINKLMLKSWFDYAYNWCSSGWEQKFLLIKSIKVLLLFKLNLKLALTHMMLEFLMLKSLTLVTQKLIFKLKLLWLRHREAIPGGSGSRPNTSEFRIINNRFYWFNWDLNAFFKSKPSHQL